MVKELGFAVEAFSSAEEFLASECVGETRCLILEVRMPGMSGPDLQRELTLRRQEIPIVRGGIQERGADSRRVPKRRRYVRLIERPPSTSDAVPVTNEESSDAR